MEGMAFLPDQRFYYHWKLVRKRVLESGVCRGSHGGDGTVGRYLVIHGLLIHQDQMSFLKEIGAMERVGFLRAQRMHIEMAHVHLQE